MKLQLVPKALAIVVAMVLQASATLATAQTGASYKYAVSITISEPIGSASALTAVGPKKPSSTKWSPCASATALDQLNFTLKYDAGKTVTTGATPPIPDATFTLSLTNQKKPSAVISLW